MKKNKFLKTDNIFLDSSIFEEQNFTSGTKIHSLFYYAKIGVIKIHVTTISKRELPTVKTALVLCALFVLKCTILDLSLLIHIPFSTGVRKKSPR